VPSIPLREVAHRWISRIGAAFVHEDESKCSNPQDVGHRAAKIKVIVMTFSRQNHQALAKIAANHDWQVLFAGSWADILRLAKDYETGVVLIDLGVLGTDWREAVSLLLQTAPPCCEILICSTASDHFCEQFIEAGGYNVVKAPLQEIEVVRTITSAWTFWKHHVAQVYGHGSPSAQ